MSKNWLWLPMFFLGFFTNFQGERSIIHPTNIIAYELAFYRLDYFEEHRQYEKALLQARLCVDFEVDYHVDDEGMAFYAYDELLEKIARDEKFPTMSLLTSQELTPGIKYGIWQEIDEYYFGHGYDEWVWPPTDATPYGEIIALRKDGVRAAFKPLKAYRKEGKWFLDYGWYYDDDPNKMTFDAKSKNGVSSAVGQTYPTDVFFNIAIGEIAFKWFHDYGQDNFGIFQVSSMKSFHYSGQIQNYNQDKVGTFDLSSESSSAVEPEWAPTGQTNINKVDFSKYEFREP